jgi:hypothetical protein
MRDSFVQAVAPALPLQQLLREGREIGIQLRERPRQRKNQLRELACMINECAC